MKKIELVNLKDITTKLCPNSEGLHWEFAARLADVITKTGFMPQIVANEEEVLNGEWVEALRYMRDEGWQAPRQVAVRDGEWLIDVRVIETKTEVQHHYHYDRIYEPWVYPRYPITWTVTNTWLSNAENYSLTDGT